MQQYKFLVYKEFSRRISMAEKHTHFLQTFPLNSSAANSDFLQNDSLFRPPFILHKMLLVLVLPVILISTADKIDMKNVIQFDIII